MGCEIIPPRTWPAWALFRRGLLLYDRLFFSQYEAEHYAVASYADRADEDTPAKEWVKIEGVTAEPILITRS